MPPEAKFFKAGQVEALSKLFVKQALEMNPENPWALELSQAARYPWFCKKISRDFLGARTCKLEDEVTVGELFTLPADDAKKVEGEVTR